ncbi:hypothetical protein [Robiginitalea marina]|uniref:Uncharacterized protein n=1 Tax=Robiginitalea marina TaxID=2954105 RepID=A0ABT1AWW8_9FLAO|nr:hypothetical protein [Robiginitalea marina]MCO5724107.1 hypothetical protein [Robiginitalea marina]
MRIIILFLLVYSSLLWNDSLNGQNKPPTLLTEIHTEKGFLIFSSFCFDNRSRLDGIPQEMYFIPADSYDYSSSLSDNLEHTLKTMEFELFEVPFDALGIGIPNLKVVQSSFNYFHLASATEKNPYDYFVFYGDLHWDKKLQKTAQNTNPEMLKGSLDVFGELRVELKGRKYHWPYRSFGRFHYLVGFSRYDDKGKKESYFINLDHLFDE